jgi:hypothetical protein
MFAAIVPPVDLAAAWHSRRASSKAAWLQYTKARLAGLGLAQPLRGRPVPPVGRSLVAEDHAEVRRARTCRGRAQRPAELSFGLVPLVAEVVNSPSH